MRRLPTLLADPRVVWVAVACAFALRLWYGLRFFPRELRGDEHWYVETATLLLRDGLGAAGSEFYIRPPGTTFLFAGVFAVFGVSAPAVAIVHAALTSASVWMIAAIARAVLPRLAWAAAALAWVQVAHPWELSFTGSLLSETVTMPLTLLFVLACVAANGAPAWRRVAAVAVVGALLVHVRVDCLPIVVAAPAWAALSLWRRGTPLARAAPRWAAAAVGALLLCIPWSLHVSSRVGERSFLFSQAGNEWLQSKRGFATWMSAVSMRQEDWVQLIWFPHWIGAGTLPADAFDTPAEETEVRELLEAARDADGLTPEMDARFQVLGDARRERAPLRFYVWLPIERSARMWLDVTDRDYGFRERPPYSTLQRASRAWRVVFSGLAALGFVSCFVLVFRVRETVSVVAAVVLVRTYGLLFAGPVVNGVAAFEGRYLSNADSLALVALAGAAGVFLARRPPEPPPAPET